MLPAKSYLQTPGTVLNVSFSAGLLVPSFDIHTWSSFSHRVISRPSLPRRHHHQPTSTCCSLAPCVNASPSTSVRPESKPVRKKRRDVIHIMIFASFSRGWQVLHPFFDTHPDPRRIISPPLTIAWPRKKEKTDSPIECA